MLTNFGRTGSAPVRNGFTRAPENLSKRRRALQRATRVAIEAVEARVLLSGATDVSLLSNGNLLIADSGTINDMLTISRNGTDVRVTDPGNPLAAGSGANQVDANTVDVPLASITGNIQVDAGAGDDTLTIDTSNGLMPGVAYDGGAGFDTLQITGMLGLDSETYNFSSDPSSGTIGLVAGGVTETVLYTHIEPILDTAPAATITVNGTNAENAINYTMGSVAANGLVSVDGSETLEFSNKDNLIISGLAGSDTINLNNPNKPVGSTPGGLKSITVNGADPTASDTLIVNGIAGQLDNLRYIPTSVGAGTVINDNAPQPNVNFTGIEHLKVVVQQADGDGVRADGTTGNDAFEYLQGVTSDSGTLVGTMDQNNATGSGPFTMTPMEFSGASPVANDFDINFFNADGTDSFVFNGTADDDNIIVTGGEAGGTDIRNTLNGIIVSRVEVFNIASALVRGLAGNDTITANVPAGPAAVSMRIEGGDSAGDTLNYNAPGGAATTIDYGASTITSPGANPITFSGIEKINETSSGAGSALTVNGTGGDDSLTYSPTGATAGTVTLAGANPLINFSGVGSTFNIDALAGVDTVAVNGNAAGNQIALTGILGAPTVQVDTLKTVTLPTANTEALVIAAGLGDDNLTINSAAEPVLVPVTYDGGGGTDGLALTGGTASSDTYTSGPQPGAGNSTIVFTSGAGGTQVVNFLNLEPVTDTVAGALAVNGTTGADNIDYGQGPTAAQGEVAVNGFEPIIFANKTTLTLNGGFGNDAFTIDNNNTPTGLTAITVNGGVGIDSLLINAYNNAVDFSVPGVVNVAGQPPINYTSIESITIINVPDSITVTPATINGAEGQLLSNIGVGTFTGGPIGAVGSDFTATIDWGDGQTSTGTVTGSAGSFAVTGTHTYGEEGTYSPIVTVTDPNTVGHTFVGGVPITIYYTSPLSGTIDDSATISDVQLTNFIGAGIIRNITEGQTSAAITGLATFIDPGGAEPNACDPGGTPDDHYSTLIHWGDGSTSAGHVVNVGGNKFRVDAPAHPYAEEGTYTISVDVTHETEPTLTADAATVKVKDAPLTASGKTLNGIEGRVLSGTVATFTDAYTGAPTADFTATVNWGDGKSSAGVIVPDGGGHFHVTASHAYAEQLTAGYKIKVTIKDIGGSSVVANSLAKIADAPLDSAAGLTLNKSKNVTFTNLTLGSFRDQDSLNTLPSDYTGTISWGDGSAKTAAKFVFTSSTFNVGSFWKVQGTHKYTHAGTFTVTITVKDDGAPLVITATIKVT